LPNHRVSLKRKSARTFAGAALVGFLLPCFGAGAQGRAPGDVPRQTEISAVEPAPDTLLPDAPSVRRIAPSSSAALSNSGQQSAMPLAGRYDKYIQPGEAALRLTPSDKFVLGFRDAFSPTSIAVWVLVAGYEQVLNGSPNWPQTDGGFLRRAGAAAARDTSNGVFGDSVFAPIFHQDPRYYRIGRRRNLGYRLVYALTRPLVTRTDGGRSAPNLSLVAGTAFGSWLTNAYYPAVNQGLYQTAKTFGGSMGSSALGFAVAEFADDVLESLHLKRPE